MSLWSSNPVKLYKTAKRGTNDANNQLEGFMSCFDDFQEKLADLPDDKKSAIRTAFNELCEDSLFGDALVDSEDSSEFSDKASLLTFEQK